MYGYLGQANPHKYPYMIVYVCMYIYIYILCIYTICILYTYYMFFSRLKPPSILESEGRSAGSSIFGEKNALPETL